ncbi:hypothetical protein [Helicobacter sp. 23-1045]
MAKFSQNVKFTQKLAKFQNILLQFRFFNANANLSQVLDSANCGEILMDRWVSWLKPRPC